MSQSIAPVLFETNLRYLANAITKGVPAGQIEATFKRLHRLLPRTRFPSKAQRVKAGRALGALHLLWRVLPARTTQARAA